MQTVTVQWLISEIDRGGNARWKWTTDYNRRSIAENGDVPGKTAVRGFLTLRDYDGQVT